MVTGKKNYIIYPLSKQKFSTKHCSAFSAVSIVILQPAKDLAKQIKRRERSLVTTKFPSAFALCKTKLDLYKGGTGSFYLGVVT